MRKEGEEWDSPKRSIRDSGYIDCWESERSDSLSPPRHARDDSFDSLDSIGSRSRHTPSPDGLLARGSSDGRGSDSECDVPHRKVPDVRRDDMLARRTSCSEPRTAMPFNQYLPNKSNQTAYMPPSLRRQHTDREDSRKSWSNATSPTGGERPFRFSHRASVSDESESMSMIDVRNEDDCVPPAHSQVRHELMHGQYNRMKEEENHWQDDLARWKNRRRSMSQDLIKKEEARKMMEKMMNRSDFSERRKSIKTYREIVEDKERREQELHEMYLRAKTPEEAAAVLQRYAQRFTISEAIMERLKLPRPLERSVSADPTRSLPSPSTPDDSVFSPTSPSPLRYLRQQSLPVPKFTSTVEALVKTCGPQRGGAGGMESVSLLDPRPDGHRRAATDRDRLAEQDEMERVNGDVNGGPRAGEERDPWRAGERENHRERKRQGDSASPPLFHPSPSRNTDSTEAASSEVQSLVTALGKETSMCPPELEHPDRTDSEAVGQRDVGSEPQRREGEGLPSRPTFLPMQVPIEEEAVLQTRGVSPPLKEEEPITEALPESEWVEEEGAHPTTVGQNGAVQAGPDTQTPSQTHTAVEQISQPVLECPQRISEQTECVSRLQAELKPVCGHSATEPAEKQHRDVAPTVLTLTKRGEPFAWDPEEERRRQERWQREQERMLQERYHREQEKLKQEWEKAQKEVEEEERRYHEEERKILEETVAPLTPHSPTPPLPCWLDSAPLAGTTAPHGIVRSLADWERKQQELENQANGSLENKTQREHERKETAGPLQMTGSSLQQRTCEQVAGQHSEERAQVSEQNKGMHPTQPGHDVSWSSKQHQQKQPSKDSQKTAVLDSTKNTQPASGGRRRSVSGKKLCSSCGQPLGKGAAMIIETLSLYFHIQCFKCGICKGQLGDTTAGTDVRIRNGLLNCHQCYIRSRSAGQPTTL